MIQSASDCKKLVDALWKTKTRITDFRKVRDRNMDDVLSAFANILSGELKKNFVPYQSPEPDHEVQVLKHLMASNSSEVEVIVTSSDRALGKQPQDLEDALEAVDEALFPISVALDECDGLLADGYSVISLEKIPGSPELAKYADPQALQENSTNEADAGADEPDEYDDAPQAQYNRALADAQANPKDGLDPHEMAYGTVTDNARMADGLRWRIRVLDPLTCEMEPSDDPIRPQLGVEKGQMPLSACLAAFNDYGVKLQGDRWVLTKDGKDTNDPALASSIVPQQQSALSAVNASERMVNYWQVRTREEYVILIEHLEGASASDPGELIRIANPFGGKSIGYYIIAGNTKLRGNFADRYDPPVLPMLVETQHINMTRSAMLAMAYAEASRDVVQIDNEAPVPPADATQETKSVQVKDGSLPPTAMGKLERMPDTGIDMARVHEMLEQNLDRFRSRELLAGSGSSAETGIHLARLQTQLLTQLTPFQTTRATARKLVLQDFLTYVIESGETVVIPWLPRESSGDKQAAPRKITPKLARLPVLLRYTIGADTPESKFARIQMSQQQTEFGTISMETHMENSDVKNPQEERKRIAKDSVRQRMIGTAKEPGFLGTTIAGLLDQYVKAGIEARLGPTQPPAPPAPAGPPMGPPIAPDGGGVSPVQVASGGTPVAPGATPLPA